AARGARARRTGAGPAISTPGARSTIGQTWGPPAGSTRRRTRRAGACKGVPVCDRMRGCHSSGRAHQASGLGPAGEGCLAAEPHRPSLSVPAKPDRQRATLITVRISRRDRARIFKESHAKTQRRQDKKPRRESTTDDTDTTDGKTSSYPWYPCHPWLTL